MVRLPPTANMETRKLEPYTTPGGQVRVVCWCGNKPQIRSDGQITIHSPLDPNVRGFCWTSGATLEEANAAR